RKKTDAETGDDETLHQLSALDLHHFFGIDVVHPKEVQQQIALPSLLRQQERVFDDVRRFNLGHRLQWMALGRSQHNLIAMQRLDNKPRVLYRQRYHPEIHFAIDQRLQGARPLRADDPQTHLRIVLFERRKHFRQHIQAGRFLGADRNLSARGMPLLGDHEQHVALRCQCVLGERLKHAAGCGERHLPAFAVEEPFADFPFQRTYLRRNCGLRDAQLLRGAGKTLLPPHFQERLQLLKIHCDMPILQAVASWVEPKRCQLRNRSPLRRSQDAAGVLRGCLASASSSTTSTASTSRSRTPRSSPTSASAQSPSDISPPLITARTRSASCPSASSSTSSVPAALGASASSPGALPPSPRQSLPTSPDSLAPVFFSE